MRMPWRRKSAPAGTSHGQKRIDIERLALPDDGGLDVGTVRGDAALDHVEVPQDELDGRYAVAKSGRRIEAGGVGANVVEDEMAARLQNTMEMLCHGEGPRQVLVSLAAEN